MNMEEEEMSHYGGFGSGCELHGEDFLRECTMCGIEFCSACFPQSALCPDCAAQAELDAEEEEGEPTEEEKELSLLEGFNDDEPEATDEKLPPHQPPANKSAKKAKPAPKANAKVKAKAAAKPKAKAKPAPTAKAKTKPKTRTKAKPASKKRRG
jgi:hypothetical protein